MSKEFTKSYAINRIAELNEQIVEMTAEQSETMRYLNKLRDNNKQLKQQLEEKDKLLKCYQEEEKLIADILGDKDLTIIGSRVHLKNLIVELKNKIKDKDIVIEEKDKEIELLNAMISTLPEHDKEIKEYELEKVKDFILENTMLETETAAVLTYIYQQIKELKGE